jgi:hypothetical protein
MIVNIIYDCYYQYNYYYYMECNIAKTIIEKKAYRNII